MKGGTLRRTGPGCQARGRARSGSVCNRGEKVAPESSTFPFVGTRRPAARVRTGRRWGFLAVSQRRRSRSSMLVTHHLLRETPPSPGLAVRLSAVLKPRRRDRLPEEAMSEGAHHRTLLTTLRLRLSDQRRPGSACCGRAVACRRGRRARRRGGYHAQTDPLRPGGDGRTRRLSPPPAVRGRSCGGTRR